MPDLSKSRRVKADRDQRAPVGEDATPASYCPSSPRPFPTRQQLAILRELKHRAQFMPGRRAALRHEVTQEYVQVVHPSHPHLDDLPRSASAARNRLQRMVDRGWVKELINGRQRTYEITKAGREAAKPRVL